jgi:hypothetical protein
MLTITTNKKSQVEIIGLVIIVILISLALIFVLQFSLKKPADIKKSYTHATVASSEINALVKSATYCKGNAVITVSDLMKDCALYYWQNGSLVCDNDMRSCEYLNYFVDGVLNATLIEWNKNFHLLAGVRDRVLIDKTHGIIDENKRAEYEPYALRVTGLGLMDISLTIYD